MDGDHELIWGIKRCHGEIFEQILKEWKRDKKNDKRRILLEELLNPVLTLEQTCILLCICSATARRWTNKGKLKSFRTSGYQRRFHLSDVLECLEEMTKKGSKKSKPKDG